MAQAPETEPVRPVLRVVRGEPSAEDLAVLAAIVTAAPADSGTVESPLRGRWNDPARATGAPARYGPGAWAASLR